MRNVLHGATVGTLSALLINLYVDHDIVAALIHTRYAFIFLGVLWVVYHLRRDCAS